MVLIVWTSIVFLILILISLTYSQEYLGATICENKARTIGCNNGQTLNIKRALFGRNRNNRECIFPIRFVKSCSAGGTTEKVRDQCEGQQSCQLMASRYIYGDPCKYVKKYLEVVYRCVETPSNKVSTDINLSPTDITVKSINGREEIPTKNKDILIGVIVGSLIFVLLFTAVILITVRHKKNKGFVCKRLERLTARTTPCDYQSEVSAVSNHEYDVIKAEEHIYITII